MTSSKIKRSDSIKQKSKGGRKDTILKEKKKTLTTAALKKAKGKSVKVGKKIVAKAKPVAKKVIARASVAKKVVKKVAAKKVTSRASVTKQAVKKVVAKKKVAPKKVIARASITKQVAKKVMKPTNGEVKKTALKAKPRSPKAKKKIAIESSVVAPMTVIGEDLHFIPEHDTITVPVTQTEARQIENIFHHKEETAFHQENQKVRNALPSRKTMKGFNQNRGRK